MGCLKIYQDKYADATVVSNRFIDEYMADANDAQLKVYLYLLRTMNTGRELNISDIADTFNHTERDVLRALRYWEKHGLIALEYEADGSLGGIRLINPDDIPRLSSVPVAVPADAETVKISGHSQQASASEPKAAAIAPVVPAASAADGNAVSKPVYNAQQLKNFRERENVQELIFIAEQYLGRPLTAPDLRSMMYIQDVLHFSMDLMDHLLQYCVERGKRDFRYIEKVAISWAESNVTTPEDAQAVSTRFDKTVYTIMNALGRNNSPTRTEADFINRWREGDSLDIEVILTACDRAVLATDHHRFEYADKIISSWKQAGVHHTADIAKADEQHRLNAKSDAHPERRSSGAGKPMLENTYDFEALEKELLKG